MIKEQFDNLVLDYQARCRSVLCDKAKEYASDEDRLYNFKRAAELGKCSSVEALMGMLRKHYVSIEMMAKDPLKHSQAKWDEKVIDTIDYCHLILACLEDMKRKV